MINHTSIDFHNDRLKEIQAILDKLAPHEHGDGMNECHICDQELDEAILIELRKISPSSAVADDVEAARQNEPRARTFLRSMIHALDVGDSDTYWVTLGLLNTLHHEMIESENFAPSVLPGVSQEKSK